MQRRGFGSRLRYMTAPGAGRRLAPSRKPGAAAERRSKAFLAELRRQCRLANNADRSDDWQAYLYASIEPCRGVRERGRG
jgi:hypothetical protein